MEKVQIGFIVSIIINIGIDARGINFDKPTWKACRDMWIFSQSKCGLWKGDERSEATAAIVRATRVSVKRSRRNWRGSIRCKTIKSTGQIKITVLWELNKWKLTSIALDIKLIFISWLIVTKKEIKKRKFLERSKIKQWLFNESSFVHIISLLDLFSKHTSKRSGWY